jgi:hypothetical protein
MAAKSEKRKVDDEEDAFVVPKKVGLLSLILYW